MISPIPTNQPPSVEESKQEPHFYPPLDSNRHDALLDELTEKKYDPQLIEYLSFCRNLFYYPQEGGRVFSPEKRLGE